VHNNAEPVIQRNASGSKYEQVIKYDTEGISIKLGNGKKEQAMGKPERKNS
jgi:hypothetical protein